MLGRSKKKVSAIASKDDLAALDSSVDELSLQTSELLSHFGEQKKEQPSSESEKNDKQEVKNKSVSRTGKSFDIIHNPKQTSKITSTLKTRPDVNVKSEDIEPEEPEMLPEHATNSYNETDSITAETNKPSEETKVELSVSTETPELIKHASGSLSLVKDVDKTNTQQGDKATSITETNEQSKVTPETAKHEEGKLIAFTEPSKKDDIEVKAPQLSEAKEAVDDKNVTEQPNETSNNEAVKTDEIKSQDEKQEDEEVTTSNSGELFANNLTQDSKPNGYEPVEGQQKPTVFDTKEYHLELHDWSKLKHKNSTIWYFVLLLVVIASSVAYMLLTGQKLPF